MLVFYNHTTTKQQKDRTMTIFRKSRYDIVSLWELPEGQQQDYIDSYDGDEDQAFEHQYAVNTENDSDTFCLAYFMWYDGQRWHGIASHTNTSSYGLILSADGEQAIIALIG